MGDRSSSTRVLVVLSTASVVAAMMQTIVIPIMGRIQDQLGVGPGAASWILTATLLAAAVVTPILGRLGDRFGDRRIMLLCLSVVLVGSVIAALADSLAWLIVARALQGCASGLLPLAFRVIRDHLPPGRIPSGVAIMSCTLSVGGGLGMVASGALVSLTGDHRAVFWMAAVTALVALVAVAVTVPAGSAGAPGGLDLPGALLLSVWLGLMLLPLSRAEVWGLTSARALGCFAAAAVVAAVWVAVEKRVRYPMVDFTTLSRPQVQVANWAGLLTGIALFGLMLGSSGFVQEDPAVTGYGFGASPLTAALFFLMPTYVAGGLIALYAGWSIIRFGAERVLSMGALAAAAAFAAMPLLHPFPVAMAGAFCLAGMGISVAVSTMPALIIPAVPGSQTGVANAVNVICRSMGYAMAGAGAAALLALTIDPLTGRTGLSGYLALFWICAFMCVVTAVVARVALPKGRTLRFSDMPTVEKGRSG